MPEVNGTDPNRGSYLRMIWNRPGMPLLLAGFAVSMLHLWFEGHKTLVLTMVAALVGFALGHYSCSRSQVPTGSGQLQADERPPAPSGRAVAAGVEWAAAITLLTAGGFYVWHALRTPPIYGGLQSPANLHEARLVRCSRGVLTGSTTQGTCRLVFTIHGQRKSWSYRQDLTQFDGLPPDARVPVYVDDELGLLLRVYTAHDVKTGYTGKSVVFPILGALLLLVSGLVVGVHAFRSDPTKGARHRPAQIEPTPGRST